MLATLTRIVSLTLAYILICCDMLLWPFKFEKVQAIFFNLRICSVTSSKYILSDGMFYKCSTNDEIGMFYKWWIYVIQWYRSSSLTFCQVLISAMRGIILPVPMWFWNHERLAGWGSVLGVSWTLASWAQEIEHTLLSLELCSQVLRLTSKPLGISCYGIGWQKWMFPHLHNIIPAGLKRNEEWEFSPGSRTPASTSRALL